MQQTTSKKLFNRGPYLMDGGLETTLIFHEGIELNHFASFELLNRQEGKEALKKYYTTYLDIAKKFNLDFILETPTWRASADWGGKMNYSPEEMDQVNKNAVQLMREIAKEQKGFPGHILISGCIGPRGDGYESGKKMTAHEAAGYHHSQVNAFAIADVDVISALTINYTEEAVGIALAAKQVQVPVVISFTVETNGKLPGGESLKSAIEKVDSETNSFPQHFMINCAHPTHFMSVLERNEEWLSRIKGVRANASTKSHAELDESEHLDTGDKPLFINGYKELKTILPELIVIGGCCGTDHSHIEGVCSELF